MHSPASLNKAEALLSCAVAWLCATEPLRKNAVICCASASVVHSRSEPHPADAGRYHALPFVAQALLRFAVP